MSQPNIYDEFWSIRGAILVWAVTSLSIFLWEKQIYYIKNA